MSGPLEKFISENREEFDSEIPDPKIWDTIDEKINPEADHRKEIRSVPFKRWLAAAAIVVFLGATGILYYSLNKKKPIDTIAAEKIVLPTPNPVKAKHASTDSLSYSENKPVLDSISKSGQREQHIQAPDITKKSDDEAGENKEMFYYAKLIEIKHEELKTLEKDEPLLYRQFAGDVQKLDSVYHTLKTQLPDNSNKEQVMEAMISNLQLQIGLLNRQLKIIKQIKHSKKSAYEQAYKSV